MATQTQTAAPTGPEHALTGKDKIQKLRELFADAPELGRKALDNVLQELTAQASQTPPLPVERAGRAGVRLGKVSVKCQIAAEGWFVAHPDLTVAATRLKRHGKALDEFLDKVSE